ncbi:MAG TPA: chorismate lyase [Gammaproteobacteria bacterium]|nr:chorismate lyase [Gammaproteobacteria bacterium]
MTEPFAADTDLFPTLGPWRPPASWAGELAGRAQLADWLALAGSLTEALRAACPEAFSLHIHRRLTVPLPAAGAELLQRPAGEAVHQREVYLRCGGTDLVFARSWIPQGVLPDPGEYPLGDRLFEPSADVARLRLEAAPVAGAGGETLWARRSLHRAGGGRLLVGEVFLPGMDTL